LVNKKEMQKKKGKKKKIFTYCIVKILLGNERRCEEARFERESPKENKKCNCKT
jgi:hypothetical protein